jgi:hypothetical protein
MVLAGKRYVFLPDRVEHWAGYSRPALSISSIVDAVSRQRLTAAASALISSQIVADGEPDVLPHKITAILAMGSPLRRPPIFAGAPDNSDYSGQNVRERHQKEGNGQGIRQTGGEGH